MRFFAVTADLSEIVGLAALGLLDGAAVSPAMVTQPGPGSYLALVASIAAAVSGPVCADLTASDHAAMMVEAMELANLARNIAVTVPASPAGLKTCKILHDTGTMCAVTLCFTPAQALLAARAEAAFVLPCVDSLESAGESGVKLVSEICDIFRNYPSVRTKVFATSLSSANQIMECARIGAHGALAAPRLLHQLRRHALTDKSVARCWADARRAD